MLFRAFLLFLASRVNIVQDIATAIYNLVCNEVGSTQRRQHHIETIALIIMIIVLCILSVSAIRKSETEQQLEERRRRTNHSN